MPEQYIRGITDERPKVGKRTDDIRLPNDTGRVDVPKPAASWNLLGGLSELAAKKAALLKALK